MTGTPRLYVAAATSDTPSSSLSYYSFVLPHLRSLTLTSSSVLCPPTLSPPTFTGDGDTSPSQSAIGCCWRACLQLLVEISCLFTSCLNQWTCMIHRCRWLLIMWFQWFFPFSRSVLKDTHAFRLKCFLYGSIVFKSRTSSACCYKHCEVLKHSSQQNQSTNSKWLC